jgi:Glycosyl hydrolase family 9
MHALKKELRITSTCHALARCVIGSRQSSFFATYAASCSDVTGEIAAALAHAAVAFKDIPALRTAYWQKAQWAYKQTGAATGMMCNSSDVYTLLRTYYTSTGVGSHAFFAAASMYIACKALKCPDAARYLADANRLGVTKEADGKQKWYWEVPGWDNAWWDGAFLMAQAGQAGPQLSGKPAFTQFLGSFVNKWTNGKTNGKTPIMCASTQLGMESQDMENLRTTVLII